MFTVYVLASYRYGALWIGATLDLSHSLAAHRDGTAAAFTRKYRKARLVYVERFDSVFAATARLRELKHLERADIVALIEAENPDWDDVSAEILRDLARESVDQGDE